MKKANIIALMSIVLIGLNGCGGGGGNTPVDNNDSNTTSGSTPVAQGIPDGEYKVQICTSDNKDAPKCTSAQQFDLDKELVAVLSAPEDIGASVFEAYSGERVVLVPKEETDISPRNMLAYGLLLYAQEAGDAWCGPCRMIAPASYEEALALLEENFGLTGTEEQNQAILNAYNANLERLGEQGLELNKAVYADIKAMAEALVNLVIEGDFPDLSGLEPCVKSNPRGICTPQALGTDVMTEEIFTMSKDKAAETAYETRDKENKLKPYEEAFAKLECKDTEQMTIRMYGVPDDFNATNSEPTNLRPALATQLTPFASTLHGYDYDSSINNPNIFVETLDNLPTNLTQGVFVVGLKEKGFSLNSTLTLYGDIYKIGANFMQTPNVDGNVSDLRANWNTVAPNIYSNVLSQMNDSAGQTLLSTLQSGQSSLDVGFLYTTNVDFIAVAACTPKSKDEGIPVKEVPTKLECNADAGEQYLEVWGGVADDFAAGTDATTPSTGLQALSNLIKYDEPVEKLGNFADTLAHPNSYISQLEVMVNSRPSAAGAGNDKIYVGHIPTLSAPIIAVKDTNSNGGIATLNGGTAHFIYGSDVVYDVSGNASGDLMTLLNSSPDDIDVVVSDQTEVDSVRVAMCVKKDYEPPCPDSDGDGVCDADDCAPKDPTMWVDCDNNDTNITTTVYPSTCKESVSLDLRPASSWSLNGGGTPTENIRFDPYDPNTAWSGVIWDNSMNWFDFEFGNGMTNELTIDFCACDGNVTIDQLKSDNYSKIYLDTDPTPSSYTSGYIASRSNGSSQSTMASWGPDVSGSGSIPNSSSPQDHTLYVNVKNGSGPSGVAIDGTLSLKGHLGKCTPEELLEDANVTDDNGTVTADGNWTVEYGGTLAVVDSISFEPVDPGPVGPVDGGTVIINVAGPVIVTNPAGTPYIEDKPRPIVVDVNSGNSEPSEPLPSGYSVQVGCGHGMVEIAWQDGDMTYTYTTSIGCEVSSDTAM